MWHLTGKTGDTKYVPVHCRSVSRIIVRMASTHGYQANRIYFVLSKWHDVVQYKKIKNKGKQTFLAVNFTLVTSHVKWITLALFLLQYCLFILAENILYNQPF